MKTLISVIIATCNRSINLAKVLDDLLLQETDNLFDFEVIVVDNNSSDDTKQVVASYITKFNGRLQHLFEAQQGKPYALNKGIGKAKGSIIAFTDDDVAVDARWLRNINSCFAENLCDGVGGRVVPIYPAGLPRWIQENPHELAGAVVICDWGEETRKFIDNEIDKFIGANFAFRREVFAQMGGFRTDLNVGKLAIGEDVELIERLIRAKKNLFYCGRALVWHPVDPGRLKLKFMARWHFNLGRIAAKLERETFQGPMACCAAIPLYLFKGLVIDAVFMIGFAWNKRKFLRFFRGFFRKLGMMTEYRMLAKQKRNS